MHRLLLCAALALAACADDTPPALGDWPTLAHEYRLDRPTIDRWLTLAFDDRGRETFERDERSGTSITRRYQGDFLAEQIVIASSGSLEYRAEFSDELPQRAVATATTPTGTFTIEHRWEWDPAARSPHLLRKIERHGDVTRVDSYAATEDGYRVDTCVDGACARYYYRGPFAYLGGPDAWIERSLACADGSRYPLDQRTLDDHGQPLLWLTRSPSDSEDPCAPGPWRQETRWERRADGAPLTRRDLFGGVTQVTDYYR